MFISASLEENIQLSCIHIHNICTFIPVICTSKMNKNKKCGKKKSFHRIKMVKTPKQISTNDYSFSEKWLSKAFQGTGRNSNRDFSKRSEG